MRPLAIVGDRNDSVTAHWAIGLALDLLKKERPDLEWKWVGTDAIGNPEASLKDFSGIWLIPASPYKDMEGALAAVRFARESGRPFLGTCGGFQHAMIEIARSLAGLESADHAETNPVSDTAIIAALACSLVGVQGTVHFRKGSLIQIAYGCDCSQEAYQCRYSLDPNYRQALKSAGLEFTAWGDAGEIRGAELRFHPFFVGTLFQPERHALQGVVPSLVRAFVEAAVVYN